MGEPRLALNFGNPIKEMNAFARNSRLALLASAFAATLQAPVKADLVNVGGRTYSIQTLNGSYNSNQSLLNSTPWWGNGATARTFANAWYDGGFSSGKFAYFGYDIAPTITGPGVQSYLVDRGVYLVANTNSPSASSVYQTYAFVAPLPSKTTSLNSSGSKVVVSTGTGISKNTGKAISGKLTYLATALNPTSNTYTDLLSIFAALSSLSSASEVDSAYEQLTAEPYASNLSVGLESMNRFRKNALAIALADNKINYTKTEKVKVCEDGTRRESTSGMTDPAPSAKDTNCKTLKVTKKLPWSLVIDGTNTQARLRGTEDLGSLDYNIFQSTYGV
ncbi:MAG: hypothetical protein ACO23X_11010, partial [Vulcanococcus sp.]